MCSQLERKTFAVGFCRLVSCYTLTGESGKCVRKRQIDNMNTKSKSNLKVPHFCQLRGREQNTLPYSCCRFTLPGHLGGKEYEAEQEASQHHKNSQKYCPRDGNTICQRSYCLHLTSPFIKSSKQGKSPDHSQGVQLVSQLKFHLLAHELLQVSAIFSNAPHPSTCMCNGTFSGRQLCTKFSINAHFSSFCMPPCAAHLPQL